MGGFSFRGFTYMLLIAFLIWSSNFEPCIARRGKHWRHSRTVSASLFKKKGKSHGNSHNHNGGGSKSKPKPPTHKSAPPLPKAPPHTNTPSSPPIPKPKVSPPTQPPKDYSGHSTTFNVLDYGAKGDGRTDDTKAFQATWAEACKVEASTMVVPADYVFYVGPISFSGPYCKSNIVFQLDGTIIAPTNPNAWGEGLLQWLEFSKLVGITIQGNGVIDGRGSVWWQDSPYDDPIDGEEKLIIPLNHTQKPPMPVQSEMGRKMPSIKPTALRFYGSFSPTVTGITIQNSPQCHLKFDNCNGVLVHDVTISSPGDSPNTDGIHLQNSKDVLIHSSKLACGDDCISIQTGCSNIYVHNVNCGPGHGISIGSLGKDNTRACVSNITVRDVNMHNTMNGVRIKTWQGGSGSVQGVLFSNIQVSEVQLPIVIDQFYCDKRSCTNHTSAVALAGINYEGIKGTYTVKPVHFACSDSLPCVDVSLTSVELKPVQEQYHLYEPFCWETYGELRTPTVPPIDCIQIGKPSSNRIQTNHDIC
ncbi:Pectin lyase fold/virulence factor [Sesbania bispinosa]|nr:Pectin lyase fold/virulence factor [Sesbania bispinosa]